MAIRPNWTRDEIILALDLYFRTGYPEGVVSDHDVISLSQTLKKLHQHNATDIDPAFRNNNGVRMKLSNFLSFDDAYDGVGLKSASHLDREIWNEFANDRKRLAETAEAIRSYIEALAPDQTLILVVTDDIGADEGSVLTKFHTYRERDHQLAHKKKKEALSKYGTLACEVCGFDFSQTYGPLGAAFAECHHITPLHMLRAGTRTKLEDLAIVCANCHRMLHRRKRPSMDELREIIAMQRRGKSR